MIDDPDSAKAANCHLQIDGKEAGMKCAHDGCTYTEPGEIIYWEHTPGDWIIDEDSTTETEGKKHSNCIFTYEDEDGEHTCGALIEEKIPVKEEIIE